MNRDRIGALTLAWLIGCAAAVAGAASPDPTKGPVGPKTPGCRWGATVHDPVNGQHLWFGGTGGRSRTGGLRTWVLKDGAWSEPTFGTEDLRQRHARAEALARRARDLSVAVSNRYYLCETKEAASAPLNAAAQALIEDLGVLGALAADEHGRAVANDARTRLHALASKLAQRPTVKEVADARAAWQSLVKLAWAFDLQPSLRCNAAMAFDAATKTIVLFGGEGVHGTYADTWIYDCVKQTWREGHPPLSPSPRMGHGMVAHDGMVYLVGGFAPRGTLGYVGSLWWRMPIDVWGYDIRADRWRLLKAPEGKRAYTRAQPAVKAAVAEDGATLSWSARVTAWGRVKRTITGSLARPAEGAGTEKHGVPPGAVAVRGMSFDPAWYEDVPPADPNAVTLKLAALPANKWVDMKPPRVHFNRDWGTTVLDPERDQLLQWAGGHSAHCGTDVSHYSLATNRWRILYTPEMPFEYCYSNSGAPYPTMTGRPWAAHTYLSYAVDRKTGLLIWTGRHGAYRLTNPDGTFLYDPEKAEWSYPKMVMKGGTFDPERHKTCMAPSPRGVAVWACKRGGAATAGQSGLWMADIAKAVYEPVAATDYNDRTTLPHSVYGDRHGMTYDSKRDRALIFHFGVKGKYKVWAVALDTGKVTVHQPKGSAAFPPEASFGREATYLPEDDLVLIGTRVGKKGQATLIYDCAADAWLQMAAPCTKGKKGMVPGYGVGTGIEWDPKRKLLWLVQSRGTVYVMRFDRKTADLNPLAAG